MRWYVIEENGRTKSVFGRGKSERSSWKEGRGFQQRFRRAVESVAVDLREFIKNMDVRIMCHPVVR